jgi:hypothetical protein
MTRARKETLFACVLLVRLFKDEASASSASPRYDGQNDCGRVFGVVIDLLTGLQHPGRFYVRFAVVIQYPPPAPEFVIALAQS